ncbi:MAG: AI-2E family transporter [Terriglobales bacterium]
MALLDTRTLRAVFTVMAVAAAVMFAYAARRMLLLFLFSIFFAYLIDPLVTRVEPWVKGRGRAIAAVYITALIAIGLFGYFFGGDATREGRHLVQSLPDLYHKFVSGNIAFTLGSQHGWSYHTIESVKNFLAGHSSQITAFLTGLGARMAQAGKNIWWIALIPILGIFFLKDGRKMTDAAVDLFSRRRNREFVEAVLEDINVALAQYIRAQLILAALAGAVYTVGLLVLRVPYAFVIGPAGGVLEFLPVVGPLIAFIGICAIAVASGYNHLLLLLLFLGAWRGMQDYYNSPRIMGNQLELHPLAALFGILVGAEIGGVVGVYLSIPAMASLRIVWRHWRAYMDGPQIVTPPLPGENAA